jgi:hypothetical protein
MTEKFDILRVDRAIHEAQMKLFDIVHTQLTKKIIDRRKVMVEALSD